MARTAGTVYRVVAGTETLDLGLGLDVSTSQSTTRISTNQTTTLTTNKGSGTARAVITTLTVSATYSLLKHVTCNCCMANVSWEQCKYTVDSHVTASRCQHVCLSPLSECWLILYVLDQCMGLDNWLHGAKCVLFPHPRLTRHISCRGQTH